MDTQYEDSRRYSAPPEPDDNIEDLEAHKADHDNQCDWDLE